MLALPLTFETESSEFLNARADRLERICRNANSFRLDWSNLRLPRINGSKFLKPPCDNLFLVGDDKGISVNRG